MSVVSGHVLRPLLSLSKSDIRIHAREYRIRYREDSSNHNTDYDRNKIRQQIVPLIRTMNPSIEETLSELGNYIQDISGYMIGQIQDWLSLALDNS